MTQDQSPSSGYSGSFALLVALVVLGAVAIVAAWRGLAALLVPAIQLPYAVSGAIGGIAVLGFALGIASVQSRRRREAAERAEFARVIDAASALLATLRAQGASR